MYIVKFEQNKTTIFMNRFLAMLLIIAGVYSCNKPLEYKASKSVIIPAPLSTQIASGNFVFDDDIQIRIEEIELMPEAKYFESKLTELFQVNPVIEKGRSTKNSIHLSVSEDIKDEEGYELSIGTNRINVIGSTPKGVFYGLTSLIQIIANEYNETASSKLPVNLPLLKITDQPEFKWRSFMLDEGRYFKGAEQVKKLLDEMALLKMNVFHWHLTDDQGWRIEIKKYPELTNVGSKRSNSEIGGWSSGKYSNQPHEGYYTQGEIKEIIKYAAERKITIVPEIGMPGHASAAIVAYPWVGTLGELTEVPYIFRKYEDSFNVTDPRVVQFLKDIIDEVVELFPGDYIHIGGDEVVFPTWNNTPSIVNYMKENEFKSPTDLQVAFTNQMARYIESKGKKMIGWNEIVGEALQKEQGNVAVAKEELSKSAVVQFWIGEVEKINEVIERGYYIVNSYNKSTYLDYNHKRLSLEMTYNFSPIPEGLDAANNKYVLGLGAQMWGEFIPEIKDMDRQVFPRIAALAEVGWSARDTKDYAVFCTNLKKMYKQWEAKNIGFKADAIDIK